MPRYYTKYTALYTLFRYRPHTEPVATVVPTEVVIATGKAEDVRERRSTIIVGRRTTIAATVAVADKPLVAITGSGKEDAVTGLFTCYFIAILATLCCPLPGAVV